MHLNPTKEERREGNRVQCTSQSLISWGSKVLRCKTVIFTVMEKYTKAMSYLQSTGVAHPYE
jgi:hypothetical protein